MAIGNVLVGGNYPENTSYLGIPFIVLIAIISIRYWKQRWL